MVIRFDDRIGDLQSRYAETIELAYAVTVHKSQGSEFRRGGARSVGRSAAQAFTRNILYTAITTREAPAGYRRQSGCGSVYGK